MEIIYSSFISTEQFFLIVSFISKIERMKFKGENVFDQYRGVKESQTRPIDQCFYLNKMSARCYIKPPVRCALRAHGQATYSFSSNYTRMQTMVMMDGRKWINLCGRYWWSQSQRPVIVKVGNSAKYKASDRAIQDEIMRVMLLASQIIVNHFPCINFRNQSQCWNQ